MSKRIGKTYVYAVTIFSLIVLSYSLWILIQTIQQYSAGRSENSYFGLFAAGLGIILSISSLMRVRNKMVLIEKKKMKVFTTIKCKKCDFKIIREFTVGDYVHKEVDDCKQCKNKLVINNIYQEKPKEH